MLRSAYRAAVAEAHEALRVCRLVGDRDGELAVVATRAQSLALLGHADDAIAAADVILAGLGSRTGAVTWHLGTAVVNELAALWFAGQFEAAVGFEIERRPIRQRAGRRALVAPVVRCDHGRCRVLPRPMAGGRGAG